MTYLRTSIAALGLIFSTTSFSSTTDLCSGFVPENDFKVPISVNQVGGISQADFEDVLNQVQKYYEPIVAAKGGTLRINRLWTDDTVNASAQRRGEVRIINMYGGLARFPVVTKDTFLLVACHEMGHHLGGAPKIVSPWGGDWATNEGQADYYSTLRCMRFLFNDKDNEDYVNTHPINPVVLVKCGTAFSTQAEKNLCMRMSDAGMNAALIFQKLRKETNLPKFDTPDPRVVGSTEDSHPATQCRLDTYFQGGLCLHDSKIELSDTDVKIGSCMAENGHNIGLRPACWFKN